MVTKQTRKSSEQIREKILSSLTSEPLSTEQLRKKIDSNWSTINSYLEELKKEGKVRELFARENLRIFSKSDYPVFYGLPLEKETINKCLYLLQKIIEEWNSKKQGGINKTTLQKIAVEIALKNPQLNIPVVRFHYGKVLPVFINPYKIEKTCFEKGLDKEILILIEQEVEKEIKQGNHTNIAWKEKREQYKKHKDMKIFDLGDKIIHNLLKANSKDYYMPLLDLFYEFFLEIPSSDNYSYFFERYHEFLSAIKFIFESNEFIHSNNSDREHYLKEILETFNLFWLALTTEFFFEDFEKIINKDYKIISDEIKKISINAYSFEIEEKINNLSEYKKALTSPKKELSEEEKKILNIFLEGANEE